MEPGDLVLVPFPRAEGAAGKFRPALVIAVAPDRHGDVLLMQVTSRSSQLVEGYYVELSETAPGFAETGLKTTSFVRVTRLATVTPELIVARLGQVPGAAFRTVREHLGHWIQG